MSRIPDEIIEQVRDAADLLEIVQESVQLKRSGSDWRGPCPFHGGESRRSLQVTRHAWRCWSGCGQGNSVHLVARALGFDYREARDWLAHELGLRSHQQALPPRR